jgi:hypothetical protein
VHQNIELQEIVSSNPLKTEQFESSNQCSNSKLLKLSKIKPSEITSIFLPMEDVSHQIDIIEDNKIKSSNYNELTSPLKSAVNEAMISSVIYGVLLGIVSFFLVGKINKDSKKQLAEVKNLRKKNEENSENIKEVKKVSAKIQAMNLLKIRDYRKELDFWRNLIKKLLYDTTNKSFKRAKDLIENITSELKTYSTREKTLFNYELADEFNNLSDISAKK